MVSPCMMQSIVSPSWRVCVSHVLGLGVQKVLCARFRAFKASITMVQWVEGAVNVRDSFNCRFDDGSSPNHLPEDIFHVPGSQLASPSFANFFVFLTPAIIPTLLRGSWPWWATNLTSLS